MRKRHDNFTPFLSMVEKTALLNDHRAYRAGVKFCGLAIFCVLGELILAIGKDWCFLLEINFCVFIEVAFK